MSWVHGLVKKRKHWGSGIWHEFLKRRQRPVLVALKTRWRGPDTCLIPPPTTMLFLHKPHKTSPILVITGPSNKKSIIALLQTFQEQDSTVIKIASRQAKPLTVKLGAKAGYTVIHWLIETDTFWSLQVCPVNIFQGINTLLAKYLDLNPVNSFAVKIADLSGVKKSSSGHTRRLILASYENGLPVRDCQRLFVPR